jgi:hypothetical protein
MLRLETIQELLIRPTRRLAQPEQTSHQSGGRALTNYKTVTIVAPGVLDGSL